MAETTSKVSAAKKAAAKPVKATGTVVKAKKPETKKAPVKASAPVAAKSAAVKKPAATRKSGEDKVLAVKRSITNEQRYRMIAEAAYYRAESRHFKSDPVRDWIEAERDIAILLGEDK
jgi:hypothetical protein